MTKLTVVLSRRTKTRKARMNKFIVKTTINCFSDSKGMVHKVLMYPGQIVNQHF